MMHRLGSASSRHPSARWTLAAYVVAIAAITAWVLLKPIYDWDLFGYAGAALAMEGNDTRAVHRQAYRQGQAVLPPHVFRELVESDPYRQRVAKSSDEFAQQLPFYSIRPLYVAAILGLHKLGLNVVHAMGALSTVAYFALAMILFAWVTRHVPGIIGTGIALLLAINTPLLQTAKMTTPDVLSAALLLFAFYMLVERRAPTMFAVVMFLSIFIRPDNLILALMAFAYLGFLAPSRYRLPLGRCAIAVAACGASYLAIHAFAGHYGWATLFYHTFIENLANPGERLVELSAADYIGAVKAWAGSIFHSEIMLFLFLGLVGFHFARRLHGEIYAAMIVLLTINIAVRYALFPVIWDRVLIAHYLLLALLSLAAMAKSVQRVARPAAAVEAATHRTGKVISLKEKAG